MKKLRLVSLLLAAIVLMEAEAQTDSTAVRKDSVTWNQSLDGVTVTAQRQLIKQDIDRIGYDVQADEDSRTENVLDMLRKVPMVTIDGNLQDLQEWSPRPQSVEERQGNSEGYARQ